MRRWGMLSLLSKLFLPSKNKVDKLILNKKNKKLYKLKNKLIKEKDKYNNIINYITYNLDDKRPLNSRYGGEN